MSDAQAQKKPEFSYDELRGMDMVAKTIDAMPAGPAKEYAKKQFANAHSQLLESYDMPVQVVAPDQLALKVVDYGSGLARTAAGETARAAKAAYDEANHTPTAWTPHSAVDAFESALNPINGRPAKSSAAYMQDLEIPSGPSLSDVPGAQSIGIRPGGPLDVTARGAAGFGMDMGFTPRNVEGALSGGENAAERAAGKTAQELRNEGAAARSAARSAGAPSWADNLQSFGSGLKNMLIDPAETTARALHDWRFRFADEAARLKGKPLPSQIMWDANLSGVTSKGIRADMEKVLAGNESEIDNLLNEPKIKEMLRGQGRITVPRGTPDDYNYVIDPAQVRPNSIRDMTGLQPLYSPEQKALEADLVRGAGAQDARASIEAQMRRAEAINPGLQKVLAEEEAQMGLPLKQKDPMTGEYVPLYKEPPTTVTSIRPERTLFTDDGFIKGHMPAKTVTNIEGSPAIGEGPASLDPLQSDRDMSFDEVRALRRGAQGEAKARNWYNRRQNGLDPYYPGDPKNIEAEAALWGKMAEHASNLETGMMDEAGSVAPETAGAGGKLYKANQDTSALLEGGPWLDRAPKTGATRRSQQAFNPFEARTFNMAEDAAGTGAMTAAQALRSPWSRYVALPAARAGWLNYDEQKQDTPTYDQGGRPGGENPWAMIYKYGAKQ